MNHAALRHAGRRRGTVLIIAMIVLFSLAALVLTLGRTARTEALTAANARSSAEADAAERGGEAYAMATLASYSNTLQNVSDSHYQAVQVGGGYFWIIRANYNDANISTWGLMDESAKLNLNTVTDDQLSYLPFMTSDLQSDILAWRGDGSSSNSSGMDGGAMKGDQYETVDEMRLLPSMTADLMYGQTTGGASTNATASSADSTNVNTDWYQQHGIFDYFTVWSKPASTAADGTARVGIDPQDNDQVNQILSDKISKGPVQLRQPEDIFQLATSLNLTEDEFSQIEDYLTTGVQPNGNTNGTATTPSGLINPNYASPEVLESLGISQDNVQQLISARANGSASYPNSLAWVYQTLQGEASGLGRLLTAHGAQYSADIVGVSGDGRSFRRVRIVIDTSSSPMKIVYRRDITDRGWPLDSSILTSLRAGQFKSSTGATGGLSQ